MDELHTLALDVARKMGVSYAVNPKERPLADVMKHLGMTEGFDVALEMSGNADGFRQMLQAMNNGGRVAILGIPSTGGFTPVNDTMFGFRALETNQAIYGEGARGVFCIGDVPFVVDTLNSRILRFNPETRKHEVFRADSNRANGLLFDGQGRLIACEGSGPEQNAPRVTRTDMKTGKVETIAARGEKAAREKSAEWQARADREARAVADRAATDADRIVRQAESSAALPRWHSSTTMKRRVRSRTAHRGWPAATDRCSISGLENSQRDRSRAKARISGDVSPS